MRNSSSALKKLTAEKKTWIGDARRVSFMSVLARPAAQGEQAAHCEKDEHRDSIEDSDHHCDEDRPERHHERKLTEETHSTGGVRDSVGTHSADCNARHDRSTEGRGASRDHMP